MTGGHRTAARRLLVLAVAAAVVACGGGGVEREGDPALDVTLRLSPTPPMTGESTAAVEVAEGGRPAPPGTRVSALVSAPNVPSGDPWELSPSGPGRWEGPVVFPTFGPVVVEVAATLPDGRSATYRFPVTVARRPGG